jgi:hypothetical protein
MVVGVGWVNPAEVIRDPVTTSSSRVAPVVSVSGLDASAAPAWTDIADKANTDTKQRYKSRLALGISLKPRTEAVRGSCYERNRPLDLPKTCLPGGLSIDTLSHKRQSKKHHLCCCCKHTGATDSASVEITPY